MEIYHFISDQEQRDSLLAKKLGGALSRIGILFLYLKIQEIQNSNTIIGYKFLIDMAGV